MNKEMLDYTLISNLEFEDVDMNDYPDLCDAFISSADYDGDPMPEDLLDILNEDRDYVHEQLLNYLY
jgi:hypothetical protein